MRRLHGVVVAAGIAGCLGLATVGICFWRDADRQDARWRDPENTKPVRAPVDLSKRAEYRVDFEPKLHWSHGGLTFILEADPPILEGEDTRKALNGLVGRLKWTPPSGDSCEGPLQPEVTLRLGEPGPVLGRVRTWIDAGKHTVLLSVAQPATRLAGRRQKLVIRFDFCPCEYAWPAFFGHAIGVGCGVLAFLIGSLTMTFLLRPPYKGQEEPTRTGNTS